MIGACLPVQPQRCGLLSNKYSKQASNQCNGQVTPVGEILPELDSSKHAMRSRRSIEVFHSFEGVSCCSRPIYASHAVQRSRKSILIPLAYSCQAIVNHTVPSNVSKLQASPPSNVDSFDNYSFTSKYQP
jgi:hypothetical protein